MHWESSETVSRLLYMLHQSKIYCQRCNSVSTSWLCPLPKQWPWSMDLVHTSGCAGADCVSPVIWTIRASDLELRFINVILSLSGLWCSPSLAAVSKGGFLTVFRLSTWEDRLGPWASWAHLSPSVSSGAAFLFHGPHLQLMEAMVCFCPNPLLDGWGDVVNSLVWGILLVSKCRLKMRRAWRHFCLIGNGHDKPVIWINCSLASEV